MPILFFYVYSARPVESVYREGFAYLAGLFLAILSALLTWLLFSGVSYEKLSPFLYFVVVFLLDSVIPFIVLPLLAFLIFKARFSELNAMLVSLVFGISSIYLPYIMYSRYLGANLWPSFMVPLGFVSLLFFADAAWRQILERRPSSISDLFPELLIPLSVLIINEIVKVLWFFGYPSWIYWIVSLITTAAALLLRLYKYFR